MALIVNSSQPTIVRGVMPLAAYSRVVSLQQTVPADGAWYSAYTEPLGNDLWLLGIDLWTCATALNVNFYSEFEFRVGQGPGLTTVAIRRWEDILPVFMTGPTITTWRITDGLTHMHWSISKRYSGQERRLALIGRRFAGMGPDILFASFLISEG